ncbi:MAG: type I-E CRISPR-associated protein Cas6/Cse3/CasE [Candidatus Krumholzibacteriota bacterium]|nr:type I-E CRISPR-associated protein Cas6/Cse3/CasE [Candidatus Krumholzibacteriota bacterium]
MSAVPLESLYLSRLILNPCSRQVVGEISHPYEMHRTLMRAFPGLTDNKHTKARDEFCVLFRAEVDDQRGTVKVYVQSRIEPNWSFLDRLNDYLCIDADLPKYECKDIMPLYRRIGNGQILSFRLRANPTKRIGKHGDAMRGKRVELRREEEQIEWLIRKGQVRGKGLFGGFNLLMKKSKDVNGEHLVPNINVCFEGKQQDKKKDMARGHTTTHLSILFDGYLRVTDKDSFLKTIVYGIGAGKAFGFGLLSVASVSAAQVRRE